MSRPGTNYLERNCHHTGPGGIPVGPGGLIGPGFGPGGLGPLPGRPHDPSGTIFSRAGQPELVGVASKTLHSPTFSAWQSTNRKPHGA